MLQKQVLQHLLDERRMVCRALGREALLGLFPHWGNKERVFRAATTLCGVLREAIPFYHRG